jgi:multiple sugar transport system permease protein
MKTSFQLSKRHARSRIKFEKVFPYILVLPFLLLFILFFVVPLLSAARTSLFFDPLIGDERFVGLDQYIRAVNDVDLQKGLMNVFLFGLIFMVVLVLLATTAALILDAKASRFHRLAVFVPYAIPSAVAALMWGYLYSNQFGPMADIGDLFGFSPPDLLARDTVLFSLVNLVVWQFLGYNMLILYVALSSISRELFEAARVDGASPWQIAWMIKLPLLRPALGLVVFFSCIGSLQIFNEPEVLSAIAPDVINTAYTPNLFAYTVAFTNRELSYSAAISILIGGLAILFAVAFALFGRRRTND